MKLEVIQGRERVGWKICVGIGLESPEGLESGALKGQNGVKIGVGR